jgi:hypothetical protein
MGEGNDLLLKMWKELDERSMFPERTWDWYMKTEYPKVRTFLSDAGRYGRHIGKYYGPFEEGKLEVMITKDEKGSPKEQEFRDSLIKDSKDAADALRNYKRGRFALDILLNKRLTAERIGGYGLSIGYFWMASEGRNLTEMALLGIGGGFFAISALYNIEYAHHSSFNTRKERLAHIIEGMPDNLEVSYL